MNRNRINYANLCPSVGEYDNLGKFGPSFNVSVDSFQNISESEPHLFLSDDMMTRKIHSIKR